MRYVHPRLGEKVESVSGHYVLEREERIEVGGREILYFIGCGVFDTACCGSGGCSYALAPGYILKWKHTVENGSDVSEIEPVTSETEQQAIRKYIFSREPVGQVNFL